MIYVNRLTAWGLIFLFACNPCLSKQALAQESRTVDSELRSLREFLREDPPNWQSADEATQWLMQQLAPFSEGRIDSPNCGKIEKINKLWTEASDDKLGFTAQAQIFMEVDRDPKAYYERIEWSPIFPQPVDLNSIDSFSFSEEKLNYGNPLATIGHLPGPISWADGTPIGNDYRFAVLSDCKIAPFDD